VLPFPPPYPPAAGHAPERRQDGGLDLYWKAGSMAKVPARPPTPYDYRPRIWPSGCTQGAQPPQTPSERVRPPGRRSRARVAAGAIIGSALVGAGPRTANMDPLAIVTGFQ
jgi:hypothetical protein